MGTRAWLENLIKDEVLPAVEHSEPTDRGIARLKALNEDLRNIWSERGFTTLIQQQSLMDSLRRAIKDHLGENHFSLNYIKFSTDEYIEINNIKQSRVQQRNEDVKFIDDPNRIVGKAIELLSSPEWSDLAAGLAVVTGRRCAEILSTALFEKASDWSVIFTGALKRRGETQILSFEIPTLAKSDLVIRALANVRKALPDAIAMDARTVNSKYEPSVIRASDRHFDGLVPLRAGKDNLYTHLFRAIYATIATFWYCPPNVNDVEFRAAIQGHYQILDEQNPELKRSIATSRHYSDYEIADGVIAAHCGKRKGVKLGNPGVTVIETFKKFVTPSEQPTIVESTGDKKHLSTIRVYRESKPKLEKILAFFGLSGDSGNQAERFDQFLHLLEQKLDYINPKDNNDPPQRDNNDPNLNKIDWSGRGSQPQPTPSPIAQTHSILETPSLTRTQSTPKQDPVNSTQQQNNNVTEIGLITTQAHSTPLESKLDQLIDVMTLFVNSQISSQQAIEPLPNRGEPPSSKTSHLTTENAITDSSIKPTPTIDAVEPFLAIERAIDEIIAYNNTPGLLHDHKWAITINAVKLLVAELTRSQRLIEKIITARKDSINAHHQQHSLDPTKHNHRHKRKRRIVDVIAPITVSSLSNKSEERSPTQLQHQSQLIIQEPINEAPITEPSPNTHPITEPSPTAHSITQSQPTAQAQPSFIELASKFLESNDPWCKLTGLIALTGASPDNLLKLFVLKGIKDSHTIWYTLQLHPVDTPYHQLVTLVDANEVWETIALLRSHREIKPYLDTHTGKQVNAYVRERIADWLGQLGVESYSIAIEEYLQIVNGPLSS